MDLDVGDESRSSNEATHHNISLAVEPCASAILSLRALEGSREQRYLLKAAADGLRGAVSQHDVCSAAHGSSKTADGSTPPSALPAAPRDEGNHKHTVSTPCFQLHEATCPELEPFDAAVNVAATVLKQYVQFAVSHNKTNHKLIEAMFEACKVLLNSGLIPMDAVWPVPPLVVPNQRTESVFSRVLSLVRPQPQAAPSTSPAPTVVQPGTSEASPQQGTGDERLTAPAAAAGSQQQHKVERVRIFESLAHECLVAAQQVSLVDNEAFGAVSSSAAAIFPDCIRRDMSNMCPLDPALAEDRPFLAINGPNFVQHVQWLFTVSTRPHVQALASFAKTALTTTITALSKEIERISLLESCSSVDGFNSPHRIHRDAVEVVRMCISFLAQGETTTPVAEGGASHGSSSTTVKSTTNSDDSWEILTAPPLYSHSVVTVAPFRSQDAKVTCLSILLQLIVNGGPSFRKSPLVHRAVKHLIFPSILKTALSNEVDIFRLSLNILFGLYNNFQSVLVMECGAFFQHVLFRILESKNTSVLQKSLVLEVLEKIAEEPKNLLNMYLNYDCDQRSDNIYEKMIKLLDGLVHNAAPQSSSTVSGGGLTPQQTKRPVGAVRSNRSISQQQQINNSVNGGAQTAPGAQAPPAVPKVLQNLALSTLICIAEANVQWIERFEYNQADLKGFVSTSGGAAMSSMHNGSSEADLTNMMMYADGTSFAGGGGDGPLISPSSGAVPQFVVAKRKKQCLQQFYELFNIEQQPDKALQFVEMNGDLLLSDEQQQQLPEGSGGSIKGSLTSSLQPLDTTLAEPDHPLDSTVNHHDDDDDDREDSHVGREAISENEARLKRSKLVAHSRRIASFLYSQDGFIDRLVLGEFFAKSYKKESTQLVFSAWIELHDLRNKALDVALRDFLGGFKLLGEAQVVDRTMEVFAAHYSRQNPTAFSSANTAFVLSFSCCMLNTDAHSAHVTEKMTKEAFIRNNRGIDDGKDVDVEVLSGIYDRIARSEIKLRPMAAGSTVREVSVLQKSNKSSAVAVLESVPILKHLLPIAETIGDKVMVPVDAAGNVLFNTAQRKRTEQYLTEFHEVVKTALSLLREQQSGGGEDSAVDPAASFVEADSVEHAIPMWDLTADSVIDGLELALNEICAVGDAGDDGGSIDGSTGGRQNVAGTGGSPQGNPPTPGPKSTSLSADLLFTGVSRAFRVCASFGFMAHAERLLQRLYQLSLLPNVIVLKPISSTETVRVDVEVKCNIPRNNLRCVVAILEGFAVNGNAFPASMWTVVYSVVSFLDALTYNTTSRGNLRNIHVTKRHHHHNNHSRSTDGTRGPSDQQSPPSLPEAPGAPNWWNWFGFNSGGNPATDGKATQAQAETLSDASFSVAALTPAELRNRQLSQEIVDSLNEISNLELWLERLYDATGYSSQALLQMINGLCAVCSKEIETGRVFSLLRLAEFCTICTTATTRMQWRDLWANSEPIFTMAGTHSDSAVALCALDGLKSISYCYLLKEEMSLYRFQKDLLSPFEKILKRNRTVEVRAAILQAIADMIENRAHHITSGWSVLLSCMSHAALMPGLVANSWSCCELLVAKHIARMSDNFNELIFCLTSFACNPLDSNIAMLGVSYLLCCSTWLQVGLLPIGEGTKQLEQSSPLSPCASPRKAAGVPSVSPAESYLQKSKVVADESRRICWLREQKHRQAERLRIHRDEETQRMIHRLETRHGVVGAETMEHASGADSCDSIADGDSLMFSASKLAESGLWDTLCPDGSKVVSDASSVCSRVALAPVPLSADHLLCRPSGYGLRTEYHLWAALIEGFTPIVIAHTDVGVRQHAMRCLWEMIELHGRYFHVEVQDSFWSLLSSAVSAVANDDGLLRLPSKEGFLPLVTVSLYGMVYACTTSSHLTGLAMSLLNRIAASCGNTELVRAGLARVLCRLCCDCFPPTVVHRGDGSSPHLHERLQMLEQSACVDFTEPFTLQSQISSNNANVVSAKMEELMCSIVEKTLAPVLLHSLLHDYPAGSATKQGGPLDEGQDLLKSTSVRRIGDHSYDSTVPTAHQSALAQMMPLIHSIRELSFAVVSCCYRPPPASVLWNNALARILHVLSNIVDNAQTKVALTAWLGGGAQEASPLQWGVVRAQGIALVVAGSAVRYYLVLAGQTLKSSSGGSHHDLFSMIDSPTLKATSGAATAHEFDDGDAEGKGNGPVGLSPVVTVQHSSRASNPILRGAIDKCIHEAFGLLSKASAARNGYASCYKQADYVVLHRPLTTVESLLEGPWEEIIQHPFALQDGVRLCGVTQGDDALSASSESFVSVSFLYQSMIVFFSLLLVAPTSSFGSMQGLAMMASEGGSSDSDDENSSGGTTSHKTSSDFSGPLCVSRSMLLRLISMVPSQYESLVHGILCRSIEEIVAGDEGEGALTDDLLKAITESLEYRTR